MILIDTSAWVEFLRDTGSPVCERVDELLSREIAVSEAVRMEVLAGARDERHLNDLRRLLARATLIPTEATITRKRRRSTASAGAAVRLSRR